MILFHYNKGVASAPPERARCARHELRLSFRRAGFAALLLGLRTLPAHAQESVETSLSVTPSPRPNPRGNWDIRNDFLYVGYSGWGSLSIAGSGKVFSATGYIGYNPGTSGTVTVGGAGSSWTTLGHYLYVGTSGAGDLEITDGGSVSSGISIIGYNSGSSGMVAVGGAGSTWTTNGQFLYVGYGGTGYLEITDGGRVSSGTGSIAADHGSSGTVTVSGAGSAWTTGNPLYVGGSGMGSLTITDGGSSSSGTGTLGAGDGSSGTVTVNGAGSTWTTTGNLILGGMSLTSQTTAQGALAITDGGSVYVTGTLRIFDGDSVTLDGGTIRFDGYNRNAAGVFNYQSGTVRLAGNRLVGADVVIADIYGANPTLGAGKGLRIEGNATLQNTLTLAGGAFTVDGDFTQESTGALVIELGGAGHEAFDVGGALTLGGTLQIVEGDGFSPVSGVAFQLFTFDSISGGFERIEAFTLGEGLAWDFSALESTGWISVTTAVPEPAAFAALLGAATLGLAVSRRRRWV